MGRDKLQPAGKVAPRFSLLSCLLLLLLRVLFRLHLLPFLTYSAFP